MPATRRRQYVLRDGAFAELAGTEEALWNGDKATRSPNLTAIALAIGIDSTTLIKINNGQCGLSIWVKAAMVDYLMGRDGIARTTAEKRLVDFIPVPTAARQPVSA
jgi:hypothetical protein